MLLRYVDYSRYMQESQDIVSALSLMMWDQEVMMPKNGAARRAQQIATLSGIYHHKKVSSELRDLLLALQHDTTLTWEQRKNVELSWKDYNKEIKLTQDFVEKSSLTYSQAFAAWQQAKINSDYKIFKPFLEKVIDIKIEEADLLGYAKHPYDALLDSYEPDTTVDDIDILFEDVKKSVSSLLDKVNNAKPIQNKFVGKSYDNNKQWDIGICLLKQMGYDFDSGRQDLAMHPFNMSFHNKDSRVTTRINPEDIFDMISSCIHEGGHALYEQGLLEENYGLPAGHAISLGIHESQSRFWENCIGRSEAYWEANFPLLQKIFPEQTVACTAHDVFVAINYIQPSLIRVQADELTYHFHIMIRYELEKALITKELKAGDLPDAWNSLYKKYLGIMPPTDAEGVLQDIHWAHGSLGYFPTYTLGSFYAAQFFNTISKQIPDIDGCIKNGNLLQIKHWLNEHIHKHGRLLSAKELCTQVTGETLNVKYYIEYMQNKIQKLYSN